MKYIVFVGCFGPCSQLSSFMNALNLIKLTNRRLIEPIIFSHSHSANDIPYIKFSDLFDKTLINYKMVSTDRLFRCNNNNINFYYDLNEHMKFNNPDYIKAYKLYYNIDLNNIVDKSSPCGVRPTSINHLHFNVNNILNDTSKIIIISVRHYEKLSLLSHHKYLKMNNNIELITQKYIYDKFNNEPFLSVNIRRIRDNESDYKNWNQFYGFTFKDFYDTLVNICKINNINKNNIFLSVKPKVLKLYKNDIFFDKIHTYQDNKYPNVLQSYIEQNICSKGNILIYTSGSYYSELIIALAKNIEHNTHKWLKNIGYIINVNTGKKLCKRTIGIR